MRKAYQCPSLLVERYELNANIASGCSSIITFGPGAPGKETCEEFAGGFLSILPDVGLNSGLTAFYDDGVTTSSGVVCDCYYTAGTGNMTS